MRWASIDPGSKGGVVVWDDKVPVKCFVMPMIGSDVNVVEIGEVFDEEKVYYIVIEKVGGMPGQSAPAAFKFGRDVGCIIGLAIGKTLSVQSITPQAWQRKFHAGIPIKTLPKDRSRMAAQRLYPAMVPFLKETDRCRVLHDGMCDALGIGHAWHTK